MNYKDVSSKVRRIAANTLTKDDLAHRVIIRKGNTYHAFNDYEIEQTSDGWQVQAPDSTLLFTTAKVSLAWCIAHKAGDTGIVDLIQYLDKLIAEKQHDVDILTYFLDNGIPEHYSRAHLVARLMEDINSRQKYKKQLSDCIERVRRI